MFQENVSLKNYSNYKLGGPARYFCMPKKEKELKKALAMAGSMEAPVFILGGGTNILFNDNGFEGAVIKPALKKVKRDGNMVYAESGIEMSDLLSFCVREGLAGLEWAGGLPGTLGGAIRGNAGAFGGEIKDSIEEVSSIHVGTLLTRKRNNKECGFSYRSSVFKEHDGEEIIVSAIFRLKQGSPEEIKAIIDEKIAYREAKQPIYYPNVGSMFKNVPIDLVSKDHLKFFSAKIKDDPFPVVPAAVLIADAGLGGISFGGAMISPHHVNFIVNVCDATTRDVENLLGLVEEKIREKYGVNLEREVLIA